MYTEEDGDRLLEEVSAYRMDRNSWEDAVEKELAIKAVIQTVLKPEKKVVRLEAENKLLLMKTNDKFLFCSCQTARYASKKFSTRL